MTEAVDAYLQQARELLGSGSPPRPSPIPAAEPGPHAPETWAGPASDSATARTASLAGLRDHLHTSRARADQIITAAAEIPAAGHRSLAAIQASWDADKAAIAPYIHTPAGRASLLRAGQRRISETQWLITDISNRYGAAAEEIAATRYGLPKAPPLDPAAEPDRAPAHPGEPEPGSEVNHEQSALVTAGGSSPRPQTPPSRPFTAPPTNIAAVPAAPAPPSPLTTPAPALPASAAVPSFLGPLSQLGTTGQTVLASQSATGANPWRSRVQDRDPRSTIREDIVDQARRALGLPYVWGGGGARGPSGGGFDCSGLTQFAVAQATGGQLILPRTTYDQINCGQAVSPTHARPGDLVFSNFSRRGPEHVQIYAGMTAAGVPMVIEAPQRGVPVKFSELSGPAVFRRVV